MEKKDWLNVLIGIIIASVVWIVLQLILGKEIDLFGLFAFVAAVTCCVVSIRMLGKKK